MKKYCTLLVTITIVFLSSCSSSYIVIKPNKHHLPFNHSKIMTVGVINDENDSLRIQIEKSITEDLKAIGYDALSAFEEFGPKGLANPDQKETYIKLCNDGIDAVMIVALLDRSKEKQFSTRKPDAYINSYYYNRIWNYKNIRADLAGNNHNLKDEYFWEVILFNLSTLEAECTIQSSSFGTSGNKPIDRFEKQIVRKMVKEKVLRKQKDRVLRAF